MDFTALSRVFVILAAFTPALQPKCQEACRRFERKRT